jgi:hypothetical protein
VDTSSYSRADEDDGDNLVCEFTGEDEYDSGADDAANEGSSENAGSALTLFIADDDADDDDDDDKDGDGDDATPVHGGDDDDEGM